MTDKLMKLWPVLVIVASGAMGWQGAAMAVAALEDEKLDADVYAISEVRRQIRDSLEDLQRAEFKVLLVEIQASQRRQEKAMCRQGMTGLEC